jgi:ABC-type uncharacterized transport system substrate-binding protein
VNSSNANADEYLKEIDAHSVGVQKIVRIEVADLKALHSLRPGAFTGADGVVVLPDAVFWSHRGEIVALMGAVRLPAIYPERDYADDGGLMGYGANAPDNFRRAAEYVDRILKGTKPGDLPIQEPVKLDFVINLIKDRQGTLFKNPALGTRSCKRGNRIAADRIATLHTSIRYLGFRLGVRFGANFAV